MLYAIRQSDRRSVRASSQTQAMGPFLCLRCNEPVRLRSSGNRPSYFHHEKPLACQYGAVESQEHRACKVEVSSALAEAPGVIEVAVEKSFGSIRPDISARINGVPVGIEIQISYLSEVEIIRRTREYARKDMYVLWLLLWTPELDKPGYAPSRWEKWIHAAYFGRVYYWTSGLSVVSYAFEPTLRSIPRRSWFSPSGKRLTGGGYTVRLKRRRTAVRKETLHLVRDFTARDRDWWEQGGLVVPNAKLYLSR